MQIVLQAETLPISYVIDEKRYKGIPADFTPVYELRTISSKIKEHIFTGQNQILGLEIQTIVTEYMDYAVYEIVTWFRACGVKKTPMLREIKAFDGTFQGEDAILYTNNGDFCSENGYEQIVQPYTHEMWTHITPQGGRSCDQAFPYFKVQFAGHGLNLAVGWPGQWAVDFAVADHGIVFSAGQEWVNLYLKPDEKIRTPKITIMAYDGDYEWGVNLWRRWYCDHILPKPDGKMVVPHLGCSHSGDGSMPEFLGATEENQLEYIEQYTSTDMPYSLWWIDAGWYECKDSEAELGCSWQTTGSWRPDKKRFPNGLLPVSKKLAEHNMKLLLWFEPERVRYGTELFNEHQEWLLQVKESVSDGNCGYHKNYLLNLGKPECVDWLIERIDRIIKENGVGIYRQDCNLPLLRYWRENEEFSRQGINENQYVQGYLRYWDTLLERNQGLLIDSCASGGRRNDLESMRRAVPLHPTDYGYGYPHVSQAFARVLGEWIPYYRFAALDWSDENGSYTKECSAVKTDYYTYLSILSPCMIIEKPKGTAEEKLVGKIWKRAADIMVQCDFYPLSPISKAPEEFVVNQYYRPEEGRGYIQAVRQVKCTKECFCAELRDIDNEKIYVFDEMKTGQRIQMSGKQLNESGFPIYLGKREAVICFYKVL